MESKFKVGDCAQLIHGASFKMTVGEVIFSPLEGMYKIKCSWFDDKGKPATQEWMETVLNHCPQEPSRDEYTRAIHEIIPPRRH